jgi:hypothetical protein
MQKNERNISNKLKNADNYNYNLNEELKALQDKVGKYLKEIDVKKLEIARKEEEYRALEFDKERMEKEITVMQKKNKRNF